MKVDFNTDERHPYAMIYDVFSPSEFDIILRYAEKFDRSEHILDENTEYYGLLQDKAWEIHSKIFDTLLELTSSPINQHISDRKRKSKYKIQLTVLPPGFERNLIHRDAGWKQMAVVVYMSDQGDGTMLYRENDPNTYYRTIPFEPNTAFCHIPSETSWHDFHHPDTYEKNRITIMFLLVDEEDYNK